MTLIVAALLLIIARSLRKAFHAIARWLTSIMPRRVARLAGGIVLVFLIWTMISGVLVNTFFAVANDIFSVRDTATVEGITQPDSPERSGSAIPFSRNLCSTGRAVRSWHPGRHPTN